MAPPPASPPPDPPEEERRSSEREPTDRSTERGPSGRDNGPYDTNDPNDPNERTEEAADAGDARPWPAAGFVFGAGTGAAAPIDEELPPMSLPSTARPMPPELADLDTALKELLASDPQAWSDDTLHESLVGLVRLGSKLDAIASAVGGEWDQRRLYADDGSRSARARLGRETNEDPGRLGSILWRANRLRGMPLILEAWRAGEIGTDRVDVLCRACTHQRASRIAEAEPLLAWMAAAIEGFDDFARKVRLWCDIADETGPDSDPESRARKQRDARDLKVGNGLDGVKFLQGRMDAVDGEIFHRELQRLEQMLFEADWAAIRAEHGEAATVLHLPRTAGQRRADALRIMAERSAACPDDARSPRPLITVVVDQASLLGPVRELFNKTVLTAGQIAGLLTEADIERAIFDGPSRVLDLGARTRLFTGATRRAIEIRDRHCTFPGCRVDVERCHADHVIEWSDGGLTVQENGRLLCPAHNRQRPGRRTAGSEAAGCSPNGWDGIERRSGNDRRRSGGDPRRTRT